MGRQHHRLAAGLESLDQVPQRAARLRVETRGGLVEEDQFRVVDQSKRDRQSLLLPAGEVHRVGLGPLAEIDGVDELLCGHGVIEEAAEEVQQFGHGQPRIERDALQLHTDPLLDRLRVLADIQAEDLDGARIGRAKAFENLDRCRLAGAVRAQHAEHFAPGHFEGDFVDGFHVAVVLLQARDANDRPVHLRHLSP